MSDDLEGLQPNPDGIEAGGPGEDTTTAGTAHLVDPKTIDIFTLPGVSNLQSTLERQKEAAQAETRAARAEVSSLRQQLGAVLETIQQDPDQAQTTAQRLEAIALKGQLEAREQELAQIRSEQQNREAREYWTQQAQEAGLDPNSPEFREAWDEAAQERSAAPLKMAIKLHKALKDIKIQRPAPVEPQEDAVTAKKPASEGYTPPPMSAPPSKPLSDAEKDKLYGELYELRKNPTENKSKIAELNKRLGR